MCPMSLVFCPKYKDNLWLCLTPKKLHIVLVENSKSACFQKHPLLLNVSWDDWDHTSVDCDWSQTSTSNLNPIWVYFLSWHPPLPPPPPYRLISVGSLGLSSQPWTIPSCPNNFVIFRQIFWNLKLTFDWHASTHTLLNYFGEAT